MKPRTKLQREVIQNSIQLGKKENKLLPWAKEKCLDHIGYATKTRVVCMDCGEKFSPELVSRKRAVCPHCNTKLKIALSRKRTNEQRVYYAVAEIYGEFQVIRNFELRAYHKTGEKARYYNIEILQHWILPNGKREVVARNHTTNWYCDSWNGDMEIRKNYRRYYYYNNDKYDVYPKKYHPDSVFKPMYTKYGINSKLRGLTFIEAVKRVPYSPKMETLLKTKQYTLLEKSEQWKIDKYWASIKICIRNKYIVKDAGMWFDYLDLLSYFRKDLHNAHYVCPKDLKRIHDKLVSKKREIQRKEELERKKKKAIENEKAYREFIQRFIDLEFGDSEITIQPLKSVEEFVLEGDIMHHCVFTNEYFKKKDRLILSARRKEKHLETIEFNLKTMKVEQCRGKLNENTEYHDRILKIVNRNKKLIKERLTA